LVARLVEIAVVLQALFEPLLEPVQAPAGAGQADEGDVEVAAPHQAGKRRVDLLVGQVSGSTEEDEGI